MAMAQGSAWHGGGMIEWNRVVVLMHAGKENPPKRVFF